VCFILFFTLTIIEGCDMNVNNDTNSWFSVTRRKMLGSILLAMGGLFAMLNVNTLAKDMKQKGKVLLNKIPSVPKGLEEAVSFTLIEAIQGGELAGFRLVHQFRKGI
jgi:hypothetical protein